MSNIRRCYNFHTGQKKIILILAFLSFLSTISSVSSSGTQPKFSLYKTLGVPKDASTSDIKRAYRKLALKNHPDKVPPEKREEASKRFKEISRAYETLGDEEKRENYDNEQNFGASFAQAGTSGYCSGSGPGGGGGDFFFPFFGGTPGYQQQRQQHFSFGSSDLHNDMFSSNSGSNIDLDELLRQMMGGRGSQRQHHHQPQHQRRQKHKAYTRNFHCTIEELFTGATKKLKVKLPEDDVFSLEQREKIYTIHIKPWWKAGTKLKFPSTNGFPSITFVLKEKPHSYLTREGDDLVWKCSITQRQAIRGAKLKVPLPDGELLHISTLDEIPIKHGHIRTVPDKGMPSRGGKRGNLIIEFHVKS